MNPTKALHTLGQRLWLDNISRDLLVSGTLRHYIDDLSVTGLTSNPTIFDNAIENSQVYDDAIRQKAARGRSAEELFKELALEDLAEAATLFRAIHDTSGGVDGWVSMEVSPLLADDAAGTISEAARLHTRAKLPNMFIKIPGTTAGVVAIEESIFAGVPVNVTLLFSREQYLAAADAYMRGIERRIAARLDPNVPSVASLFISRWDKAVAGHVPPELENTLGIAIARRAYAAYRQLLASPRSQTLVRAGAKPQRMLWASTGTKDPKASDVLYVEALAAPETINTIPDQTLLAFENHGHVGTPMPVDGGDAEAVIARFARAGVDDSALAAKLQRDGAQAFDESWHKLMRCLASKSQTLASAERR